MSVFTKLSLSCCIFLVSTLLSACSAGTQTEQVTGGLDHPWSMVFLPDDEILVSERSGQLRRIVQGRLLPDPVTGLPAIAQQGQGGLMGLAMHPQFAQNQWLYFAYAAGDDAVYSTHLARGRYKQGVLSEVKVLIGATPKVSGGRHFGGRVLFDRAGYVYLALGDRGERELAQQTGNHAGALIRLHDDGRVPQDNPFVNKAGVMPEIYSYGHRNIQGLALNPFNGYLWSHEHGPKGGDEVNLHKKGANYGWPVISYGEEYSGGVIGEGLSQQAGMEQPLHYWVPSIAPSGMTFYTGERYRGWKGSLFVGSLKFDSLVRLNLKGNEVVSEERLLEGEIGRIRDVQQAPNGYLYVLTDESDGGLYRLKPF